MYVCICNRITDKDVEQAISEGHTDLNALHDHLGVGSTCGTCRSFTSELITEITGNASPVMYG